VTPDPLTLESIKMQAMDGEAPRCGCFPFTKRPGWFLCQYHEGFDDGVEAAQRKETP
jgi:hypothetical protein